MFDTDPVETLKERLCNERMQRDMTNHASDLLILGMSICSLPAFRSLGIPDLEKKKCLMVITSLVNDSGVIYSLSHGQLIRVLYNLQLEPHYCVFFNRVAKDLSVCP